MSQPEITVVVPVYNVENYLRRCVESICRQTFRDLEILLVDDGSTDGSGALCDVLAAEDARIRVLHKPNGGLSDARNYGIEHAEGNSIAFIDSDDYIEPEMMEVLHSLQQMHHADIAVCGVYNAYASGRTPQCPELMTFACTGREALGHTLEGVRMPGTVCNKLIRRENLQTLRFPLGKTWEDAFLTPELLLQAKTVAVTTQPLYNYWHRPNSITTSAFNPRNGLDPIAAYEYTLTVVREKCPELTAQAVFRLQWAHFVVLDRMLSTAGYRHLEAYPQVVSYLKKEWLAIARSPYFRKGRRLSALLLKVRVSLYRLAAEYQKRKNKELT